MTTREEYERWTDEQLEEHSSWLYEQYLKGHDYLEDIHLIGEILRQRKPPGNAGG